MRLLFAFALLSAVAVSSAAADAPTVKAYSVTVIRPPKDFAPTVTGSPYTSVGLVASLPDRSVIGLDHTACKVTFTDDKGTDLSLPDRPLIYFPTVRTDLKRSQASFGISVSKLPAEGATKLRVKGTLVFLCGTGEKTATAESLAIKAGEKATAGPASFEVTEMGKTLFIRVTTEEPLVTSISFTDQKRVVGALVPYLIANDKKKIVQTGINTPPAGLQSVGISVIHYEKVESVKVDFDTEVGIGG